MNTKPVIFSFFSGSGFLDLGFEKTGFDIDFVNEYSQSFLDAYIHSRKKMRIRSPKYGYHNTDIREYFNGRNKELREYVHEARKNNNLIGFIGGPPCPDFSVGGKNKGRHGENGKLSLVYVSLIAEMQPDFFLFENVKGLWRTTQHREFYEELKRNLHAAGYSTTERLTNALEFGVPQDRDRIFLFGIKKDILNPGTHEPTSLIDFPWLDNVKYPIERIKKMEWPTLDIFMENSGRCRNMNPKIIEKLTIQHWFDKNNVTKHPNANAYFQPRNGLSKMKTIQEGDVSKKSYKRLHRWRYSPTAAYGNNEVHLHPYMPRRISASEALAIQSLPKAFELPRDMNLSNMFKTIGNGVPYLMSKGIANSILSYLIKATKYYNEAY